MKRSIFLIRYLPLILLILVPLVLRFNNISPLNGEGITITETIITEVPVIQWKTTEYITLVTPIASSTTTLHETKTLTAYTHTTTITAKSTITMIVTETILNTNSTIYQTSTSFIYGSTLILPVTQTVTRNIETTTISTESTLIIPEFPSNIWIILVILLGITLLYTLTRKRKGGDKE